MEETSLRTESRGDTLVVTVSGELDIVTSPRLDECLARTAGEHSRVILDLSAVDFLDTSALAVIVGHWKQARAAGRTFALAGARYRYCKTLWITGLADKLTLYPTLKEGLAARPRATR